MEEIEIEIENQKLKQLEKLVEKINIEDLIEKLNVQDKIIYNTEIISDREIAKLDNKLVEAKYNLTLEEMRLIFLTIAQIDVNDEDFKTYQISLKDLEEKTGSLKKHSRLKNFMSSIMKKPIFIDKNTVVNWFSYIHYNENDASLDVRFDKALKTFLLSLKKNFTKFNIQNVLKLKSVYAVRIYQLLKQYESIGKRRLNVDNLREILQTPKSYSNFAEFKRKVLDVAKKEISEKTDLIVDYTVAKKIRKKVVEVEFTIKTKKQVNTQKNITQAKQKKLNTTIKQIATKKQTELNTKLADINDFKLFRTKILSEYNNKVLLFEDKVYSIKANYLALNDKILSPEEALDEWHSLFVNKDKIVAKDKLEYEAEKTKKIKEFNQKIDEIKQKIFTRIDEKGEYLDEYRVVQISEIDTKNNTLSILLQSNNIVSLNFNLKAKIDEYYNFDKFYLDEVSKKFSWIK